MHEVLASLGKSRRSAGLVLGSFRWSWRDVGFWSWRAKTPRIFADAASILHESFSTLSPKSDRMTPAHPTERSPSTSTHQPASLERARLPERYEPSLNITVGKTQHWSRHIPNTARCSPASTHSLTHHSHSLLNSLLTQKCRQVSQTS